jgi:hypothetical protein
MRGLKVLLGTTALVIGLGLVLAPSANAQVYVNIGVQPVCSYGYYGYAPYECAPMGYYGPGYFYNGIFLGMGPWGGWGYSHGWGGHRFISEGGGSYHGGPGRASFNSNGGGGSAVRGGSYHGSAAVSNGGGARPSAGHAAAPSRGNGGGQVRGNSGQSHGGGGGGGQSHGGGGQGHGGGGGQGHSGHN